VADIRKEVMGQISALRRRIDPRLLEKVRDAVYHKERSEKENARAAVACFLSDLEDGGAFRRQLEAQLARQGKRLDALLPTPAESALPPAPGKHIAAETLLAAPLPTKKAVTKKPSAGKGFWERLFKPK
jgi:hypothetical protein